MLFLDLLYKTYDLLKNSTGHVSSLFCTTSPYWRGDFLSALPHSSTHTLTHSPQLGQLLSLCIWSFSLFTSPPFSGRGSVLFLWTSNASLTPRMPLSLLRWDYHSIFLAKAAFSLFLGFLLWLQTKEKILPKLLYRHSRQSNAIRDG